MPSNKVLEGTPFKKVAGVQINITDDGKFIALLGDKLITRSALGELVREISKQSKTVKVFSIGHHSVSSLEEVTEVVTRKEGYSSYASSKYRVRGVGPLKTLYDCYVYSEPVYEKLSYLSHEFEQKRKELDNEYNLLFDELKKSLHRVEPTLMKSLLEQARGEESEGDGEGEGEG